MNIWKKIPGFSNYSVSDDGKVRRDIRVYNQKPGMLKQSGSRYLKVSMKDDKGVNRTPSVHVLVALAFLGERPDGFLVCHNNGNSMDNRSENLRYDSDKGNQSDRRIHGTYFEGELTPASILSADQVKQIVDLLLEKRLTQKEISIIAGCHQTTVSDIARGKTWRSLTGGRVDCLHTKKPRREMERKAA